MLGLGWALVGVLPLFMPSVIWQPYYTIFGACGAWIGIGALLMGSGLLRGAVILVLGLLSGVRDGTVTSDWSNLQVLRFGSAFMGRTEQALRSAHPTHPRNTRVFFTGVPLRTVFVLGGGNVPALRVWYEDDSIQGHYWSDYRPRDTGQPLGPDLFFRFDSKLNWREIIPADDSAALARVAHFDAATGREARSRALDGARGSPALKMREDRIF